MANHPFVTDMQTLRARARHHIEQGAVTEGYRADRETVIGCYRWPWRRSWSVCCAISAIILWPGDPCAKCGAGVFAARHRGTAACGSAGPADRATGGRAEFFAGGAADAEPLRIRGRRVTARHGCRRPGGEPLAIESYREMIQYFGNDDATTRRLMETILAVEEEHARRFGESVGKNRRVAGRHPARPYAGSVHARPPPQAQGGSRFPVTCCADALDRAARRCGNPLHHSKPLRDEF